MKTAQAMAHRRFGSDPQGLYREWLEEKARDCQLIAEIGVLSGRTTIRLARACPGIIYAVDHWKGVPADPMQRAIYRNIDRSRANFHHNLRAWIDSGKVRVLEMPSPGAAAFLAEQIGRNFDLVFIDADHRYVNVRRDIRAWRPLVRSGGILSGHDIGWPGVRKAVDEEVPDWKRGPGSLWWEVMP